LDERLRERISREGPISFRDFMEAALYDPGEGYYARGAAIGEGGDFVTSPSISPAFAEAIARRFREETEAFDGPLDFVEAGAGEGRFLEDLRRCLERRSPEFASRVRLTAVERSEAGRRAIPRRGLSPTPLVVASAEELPEGSVRGWIFSNELFDALPVARVEGSGSGPREHRVGLQGGQFVWVCAPADPTLVREMDARGVVLEPGQIADVAPDAAPLYRRLARALDRGALVTFDYGHRARALYHPAARRGGTLAVHRGGRRGGDPLQAPGRVDLTAHVDWDLLARAGEAEGLATRGVFRQGRFLAQAGLLDFVGSDAEKWRAFRLIDPEGMGEEMSVLIQARG